MKCILALSAVLFFAAGTAYADVVPPNSTECSNLAAGAACVDDNKKPGVCTSQTCSELDYSDGSPPGTKQVPCVLCIAPDGGTTGSSSGGGGCAVVQAEASWGAWLAALAVPFVLRRARSRSRSVGGQARV